MQINFSRVKINHGVYFTKISDPKFKTNNINIKFITELSEETSSANLLLANLIVTTNEDYPNRTELVKKLTSLYGSYISTSTYKCADNQVISIDSSCICDEYALDNEKVTGELADILVSCIFKPVIEDGGFAKKDFELRKQEMLDNIESEINEKRTYALIQAAKTIYSGEPSNLPYYGKKEIAEKLDPAFVYKTYLNLLKTAQIEITYSGGVISEYACEEIIGVFARMERDFTQKDFKKYSPLKEKVANVEEFLDVNQSKMVMAFKSNYDDIFACKLMSAMFGGTAFSKLFTNVREKLSLCYYCVSGYVEGKGVMLVDSGVESQNIELAQTEINHQLELMAKGDFTDDEFENAKLSIIDGFKSNYDSLSQLTGWYFYQMIRGTELSPMECIEQVNKVTKEQVIEVAKSMKLDTIYIMKSNENGGA